MELKQLSKKQLAALKKRGAKDEDFVRSFGDGENDTVHVVGAGVKVRQRKSSG